MATTYTHRIYDTINIRGGNVGIGTAVPTELLHVAGGMAVNSITNASGNLSFRGLNLNNIGTVNTTGNIVSAGNITSLGTITASNLSIIGDLTVLNTTTSNTEQMVITNAGTGPALKVTQTGVGGDFSVAEFYDNETGIAMKIADTGLVGIGTQTPSSRLHVFSPSGNTISTVQATSTNAAQVSFINASATTRIGQTAANTVEFTTSAAQPILIGTNGETRMVVGSAGNVGIGTNAAAYSLDVRGSSVSLAAPVYIKNGNMNWIMTSIGNVTYSATGAQFLGIRATWGTTTTNQKLAFRVTAKFHIASDTGSSYRCFESLVTPKNDSPNNQPNELVVVSIGETSSSEFTSFTNSVQRNGSNSVDIRVNWNATVQPAVGNLELQVFANTALGDFTFTPINS